MNKEQIEELKNKPEFEIREMIMSDNGDKNKMINLFDNDPTTEQLATTITEIEKLLKANKWDELEFHMKLLSDNVYAISSVVMVTWLRTTFSLRRFIPNWNSTRDTVKDELISRGFNVEKTLKGLL